MKTSTAKSALFIVLATCLVAIWSVSAVAQQDTAKVKKELKEKQIGDNKTEKNKKIKECSLSNRIFKNQSLSRICDPAPCY